MRSVLLVALALTLAFSDLAAAQYLDKSCSNEEYKEVVRAAKSELSRKLLKEPGINSVGLSNCPAFWAATVLGHARPLVKRRPECGVYVTFVDEGAIRDFAIETDGVYEFNFEGETYEIRLCGRVVGPIVAQ